jgi:toxin ParE1/3/4
MHPLIWDQAAEADLLDIWDYIARQNHSIAAAERLIDVLRTKAEVYARQPGMGTRHDDIAPELRSFRVGKYVAFYQPHDDGIFVLRVIHGHRDYARLLGGSS